MVIISQASMPDRTHAILTGDDARLLQVMREDAQALETLGCTCIAIPCNTSHYFYDKIQSFTSVPIVHMPRERCARLRRRAGRGASASWARTGPCARACTRASARLWASSAWCPPPSARRT